MQLKINKSMMIKSKQTRLDCYYIINIICFLYFLFNLFLRAPLQFNYDEWWIKRTMFVIRVEFKPLGSSVLLHRILATALGPSDVGVCNNRGLAQTIGHLLTIGVQSHCGVLHIYNELNLCTRFMQNIWIIFWNTQQHIVNLTRKI